MDNVRARLDAGQPTPEMPLHELLPSLVGPQDRTGQLTAVLENGPQFEVWLEHGRVVAASWGPLLGLTALEMAAVFMPTQQFAFFPGKHSEQRTFDLSPLDLSVRLAHVAREGAAVRPTVPGPFAVPSVVAGRRAPNDPESARLLSRIDGQRTVSDLVEGRQPLVVLRGLAALAQAGVISYGAAKPDKPDKPEAAPVAPAVAVVAPAETPAPTETREPHRVRRRAPVVAAAAVLVIVMLVGVLRAFPPESGPSTAGGQAQPAASGAAAAAVPTAAPTAAPTTVPTAVPTAAPTVVPTAPPTAVPTAVATAAPTAVPTAAPTAVPTAAPTAAPTEVAAAAPTAVPTAPPTAVPTAVATTPPTAVPTPLATTAQATPSLALLDERFASGAPGWPNSATSSAYWDSTGYHLVPRVAGQHVAIAAPLGSSLGNVSLTALFRKLSGPTGGGYGVIVRAQNGPFDGTNQGGRFYVFEIGDKGEVGAWRREQTQWVDLLGWTPSAAVNPGIAENRIDVQASGSHFNFSVNGAEVAQINDDALSSGAVGVFTGGDGNNVLLERFEVAGL